MNIHQVHELPNIESQVVGIDIETTTTPGNKISNPFQDRMVAISVSDGEQSWVLGPESNMHSIVSLINNPNVKKIGHNIQFDLAFITYQLGAQAENVYDTMLMSRMIHAGRGMRHGLDDCLAYDLGVMMDKSVREQFYSHVGTLTEEQVQYAAGDVAYLPRLREKQLKDISSAGLGKIAALENKAVLTVVDMYLAGVMFDQDLWKTYEEWINRKLREIQLGVVKITSCNYSENMFGDIELEINLGSVKQLNTLFKKEGIKCTNTQEKTLSAYIEKHPGTRQSMLLQMILEYKTWRKRLGWKYEEKVNPVTGKIHPSWNALGADTGRFSCSDPNLQQVPRPHEGEPNFRKLFIPEKGKQFITLDWSQEEVRIFAQACEDRALREACQSGDVYTMIAERVFGEKVEKGSEERFLVKTAVLACAYGARKTKLALVLGKTEDEAEKLRRMIFSTFPQMKVYADQQLRNLVQKGYTTTLLGRRRYFEEIFGIKPENHWKYASEAVNTPIQGTAADIGKLAMWKLRDWYKEKTGIRPVITVHDEFILEVPAEEADVLKYDVIGIMEQAAAVVCPDVIIPAEGSVGDFWEK